jgi:uncharacterized protein (UPF0147 family)
MEHEEKETTKQVPTVSRRLNNGTLIELVYLPDKKQTALAVYANGKAEILPSYRLDDGSTAVPIKATNNLIRHRCVLLPSWPQPYGDVATILSNIQSYLYKYIDLSPTFLRIASAYVLLSWVYDAFNELPYLRFRGDYGSGKTRALLVLGSVCYKPFFASGASTVSPIFHALDTFQGTLIFDETDFRFSDEKAELVKIFNNGNVRGFPVLRSAATPQHTFDPRAFLVFGPKIVAMRSSFDDQALESRFITEDMGKRSLRPDIPINLPDVQKDEALALRNQLLSYRFATLQDMSVDTSAYDEHLSPRLNQILAPLLSVIEDETLRQDIRRSVSTSEETLQTSRSATPEGQTLEIVLDLAQGANDGYLSVTKITEAFIAQFGKDYERPITPRYIGHLMRTRLRLYTYKRHGSFVLPLTQQEHLSVLAKRYGFKDGRQGDMGTAKGETQLPLSN